jgi:predicted HicB family RNase H-like nuclease
MKRSDRLGMRVKATDKKNWKRQATSEGKSLSAWIEQTLNGAVKDGAN